MRSRRVAASSGKTWRHSSMRFGAEAEGLSAEAADVDYGAVADGAQSELGSLFLKMEPVGTGAGTVCQVFDPRGRQPKSMPLPPIAAMGLSLCRSFHPAQAIQMPSAKPGFPSKSALRMSGVSPSDSTNS